MHFKLVDGFETLITDLAREALFYKYDGEQAIKILTEISALERTERELKRTLDIC